jgi:hypothetical protein
VVAGAAKAEEQAELPWSEGELENDSAVIFRGRSLDTQVVESKESATFDDMGPVQRPLEAVANAICHSGGEMKAGKSLNQ